MKKVYALLLGLAFLLGGGRGYAGVFDSRAGARTIALGAGEVGGGLTHIYGTFDPSAPSLAAQGPRYGFAEIPVGMAMGPEDTDPERFFAAVRAGRVPGVPSDATLGFSDYYDSLFLEAGGSSVYSVYVGLGVTAPPPSSPPACPDCPAAPACPPPVACPVCPAPVVCPALPELTDVPPDVLETLRLASGWINPIHPFQRTRLKAVYDWLQGVAKVQAKP